MYIRNLRPHFDPNLKSLFLRPQFILGKIEEQIHSFIHWSLTMMDFLWCGNIF